MIWFGGGELADEKVYCTLIDDLKKARMPITAPDSPIVSEVIDLNEVQSAIKSLDAKQCEKYGAEVLAAQAAYRELLIVRKREREMQALFSDALLHVSRQLEKHYFWYGDTDNESYRLLTQRMHTIKMQMAAIRSGAVTVASVKQSLIRDPHFKSHRGYKGWFFNEGRIDKPRSLTDSQRVIAVIADDALNADKLNQDLLQMQEADDAALFVGPQNPDKISYAAAVKARCVTKKEVIVSNIKLIEKAFTLFESYVKAKLAPFEEKIKRNKNVEKNKEYIKYNTKSQLIGSAREGLLKDSKLDGVSVWTKIIEAVAALEKREEMTKPQHFWTRKSRTAILLEQAKREAEENCERAAAACA